MKRSILLLLCLATLPNLCQAGKLYRWVDSEGTVHYGEKPSSDAQKVEERKLSDSVAANQDLPYETRRAQQNFPVVLYSTDTCGELCNKARKLLNDQGIPFSDTVLKTQEELDAFQKKSGSSSNPTLSIGKKFFTTFNEGQWHSELDTVGYPKKTNYRNPSPPSNATTPKASKN